MTVIVLGPIAWLFQRRTDRRTHCSAVLQELLRIRERTLEAIFLIEVHKSAKTWTEQLRELIRMLPRVEELKSSSSIMPLRKASENMETTIASLKALRDEYRKEHDAISALGTRWGEILEVAKATNELLLGDESALCRSLDDAVSSVRRSLST